MDLWVGLIGVGMGCIPGVVWLEVDRVLDLFGGAKAFGAGGC